MINLRTKLQLSPDVTFRSLGDGQGAVVVETKTGQLYTCNDTTTAFLEALDGTRTLGEIVDELHCIFDVDQPVLESDLNDIAGELLNNGLITPIPPHRP
ncbi:MAG: PqqD family protein [Xanthobacteraceae bacterium]